MTDKLPGIFQDGRFAKGVLTWAQMIMVVLALSSAVSYAWISMMGVQTTEQTQEAIAASEAAVEARVNGLEESMSDLQDQMRRVDQTMLCILWEVPAERCEAARR